MPTFEFNIGPPLNIMDAHYAAIGKVVANWAAFEALLQSAIWCFAKVPDDIGLCMTAQIGSAERLVNALTALARLRGASPEHVGRLEKFAKRTKSLAPRRHKVAHEPVNFDPTTAEPSQLRLSARRKVVHAHEATPTESVRSLADELYEHYEKFEQLIEGISNDLSISLRGADQSNESHD